MPQAVQPSQIKEHMDVITSDGAKIGSVDHMEGTNQIKLTKHDAPDGKHHLIPHELGGSRRSASSSEQAGE